MVRSIPAHDAGVDQFCSVPLAIGLFVSASVIVALCTNHARKSTRREVIVPNNVDTINSSDDDDQKFPPRSPLRSSRQLITTISSKTMNPFSMFNKRSSGGYSEEDEAATGSEVRFEEEEGGLWQKGILMGEKCQPPEFSGVIYYDYEGNRISEFPPRSPRASPLTSFSFPVVVKDSI